MSKYIVLAALVFTLQACWGEDRKAPQPAPEAPHAHVHVIQVAQNQYYIATCSQNDLFQRCSSLAEARRVADSHARQTGHRTGVNKE